MERLDLQEVLHAEADLELIERLGEEVPRAAGQGPALHLGRGVTGEDEDGQGHRGRDLLVQLLHDREAVGLGHVEVEQQQVELRPRAEIGHLGERVVVSTSLCPHRRSRRSSTCAFSGLSSTTRNLRSSIAGIAGRPTSDIQSPSPPP